MRNKRTVKMVQMAILIAVQLLMAFTPLGYLRMPGLSISFLTIPVAIGAMLIGPGAGAVLGAVFGITSFSQCFGAELFGTTLMGIDPLRTFLVCIPTRILMGWLTGVIFRAVKKVDKTKTAAYFVGGFAGAVLNTVFFIGMLLICFWNLEEFQAFCQGPVMGLSTLSIGSFLVAMVGVNGAVEAPAACVIGGAVSKAVSKAMKM
jgi:uncharacterized membrane protein